MTTEAIDTQKEVHNAIVVSGPSQAPIQFDVSASAIARMQKEAAKLSIDGPDDKAGFKSVNEVRLTVTRQLADVRKKQKELKRPHIDYNRDVDAAANALIEPMAAVENTLKLMEKKYNDDVVRIARENELARQQRTEDRVNQLRDLGFTYSSVDGTYDFHHGIEGEYILEINFDDIRNLSDEDYASTLLLAQTTSKKEADRLAEVKRLHDEETARIANEQRLEAERIAAENKRLADAAAEVLRQKEELEKQIKQFQKEKDDALFYARIVRLVEAGFEKDGLAYSHLGLVKIREGVILSYTDEQFDTIIIDAAVREAEAEQKRINDAAAEQLRIKNEQQAERDKKREDRARQERLRLDKKILIKFLKEHGMPKVPAITQDESADFMYKYCVRVKELTDEFTAMLEVL